MFILLIWHTDSQLMSLQPLPPHCLVFPPHWDIQEHSVTCCSAFLHLVSCHLWREIGLSLFYLTPTFHALKLKDTFVFFTERRVLVVFLLWIFQLSLTQGHWNKPFGKSEVVQTQTGFGVQWVSLSMQVYTELLRRSLAKALSQHLACLKVCVISFCIKALIVGGCFFLRVGVLHKWKECLCDSLWSFLTFALENCFLGTLSRNL